MSSTFRVRVSDKGIEDDKINLLCTDSMGVISVVCLDDLLGRETFLVWEYSSINAVITAINNGLPEDKAGAIEINDGDGVWIDMLSKMVQWE